MRLFEFVLALALMTGLTGSTMAADKYVIDKVHSSITFSVKHMMISTVKGGFDDFPGEIMLDENDITKSSVMVTIQTASINTANEGRDKHLKSPDFFDATIRKLRSRVPASKRKMVGSLRTVRSQCVLSAKRSPCRLNWPVPLIRVVES